jgi:hypothetical protein
MRTLRTAVVTTAVVAAIVIPASAAAAADSTDQSAPTIGRLADDTPWGP